MSKTQSLAIISNMLTANREKLATALGHAMKPEQFASLLLDSFRKNPALARCTAASIWNCVIAAANAKVPIGGVTAQAYLVPYRDECTLQLSYKGLIRLAERAGCSHINAQVVRRLNAELGDHFKPPIDVLNPVLEYVKADHPDRHTWPITHAWAVVKLPSGEPAWEVQTANEIMAHAEKFSRSFNDKNGPWKQHPDAMMRKTVLRSLFNSGRVPLSTEVHELVGLDMVHDANPDYGMHDDTIVEVPEADLLEQTPPEPQEAPYEDEQRFDERGLPINE